MTVSGMKKLAIPPVEAAGSEDLKAQAERLQERAHAAKFRKQADLARASGIPFQTLGSYWKGTRGMSYPNALKLAAALGNTSADYLMLGRGEPSASEAVTKMSQGQDATPKSLKIKLFQLIDVPYLVRIRNKESFDWAQMLTISEPELLFGDSYARYAAANEDDEPIAVDMKGDSSMEPRIPRDAKVLFLPGEPCQHGKQVLAVMPDLNLAVVRTLLIERAPGGGAKKILHATNNADGLHPDRVLDEEAGDFVWCAKHAIIDL